MRVSITVWQDQIILHWDNVLPPALEARFSALDDASKAKWDSVSEVLTHWHLLTPYTRYNEKRNCFFLNFSAQNLFRIHGQFGQVPVRTGQERIDALKEKLTTFRKMREQAITVKEASNIEELGYRVPPRGDYQKRGVLFLLYVRRAALFMDCGLGKTYMALVSTEIHIQRGIIERGKTLIVGKLMTLETGWLADAEKFTGLKLVMLWLPSSTYKRTEKLLKLLETEADAYLINHEGVPVLQDALTKKAFQKIVLDESTILKGFHGERAQTGKIGKALLQVAHRADWRVIMTGSPAPNGAHDLWGQLYFLDGEGLLLEPSYHDFQKTYMLEIDLGRRKDSPDGERMLPGLKRGGPPDRKMWVMPKESGPLISKIVNPYAFRAELREHLKDLPPITIGTRRVTMNPEQATHYKAMRDELSTLIDNELIAVGIRLTAIMKLRQITGGFLIDQEQNVHPLAANPKFDALDALLGEEIAVHNKVVIYAQYVYEISALELRYKKYGLCTVFGGNSGQTNLANVKAFIHDPSIRICVLHPKSAAHGITFTHAHYMIFYSISYSAEDDYQCVKRIERGGQKNAMFVYYLLATLPTGKVPSIDEVIYRVLQEKNKNQRDLVDQGSVNTSILKIVRG